MFRNKIWLILEILFDKFVLITYFGFLLTLFLLRLIIKTPGKQKKNRTPLTSKEVKQPEEKQKEENEPPFTRI